LRFWPPVSTCFFASRMTSSSASLKPPAICPAAERQPGARAGWLKHLVNLPMERTPRCRGGELLVLGETRARHRRVIPPAQERAQVNHRRATPSGPSLVRRTSNIPGFHSGVLVTSCTAAKTSSAGRPITVTTSNSFISPPISCAPLRPSRTIQPRPDRASNGAGIRAPGVLASLPSAKERRPAVPRRRRLVGQCPVPAASRIRQSVTANDQDYAKDRAASSMLHRHRST
jgi:hypothetical protein